jgi:hypothetical protein
MKNTALLLISVAFFLFSCGPTHVVQTESYDPAPEPAPVPTVSYQTFYDDLSPYGDWINYPGYGYVWMPDAGPDFRPYSTNGNWVYTDAGWTWSSDYSWGWAPFHYGRWFYEGGYGWMWVPGNEWAPAWVSWRGGGDYYGWAPLGPDVSIDVALGSYNPPMNYWNFVPRQYMGNPGWHNYYVNESRNVTIINSTTIINNYSGSNRARYAYAPGPDPNEVRRVSGAEIRPVQIREANAPGGRVSGNQFNIYRPRVDAAPSNRTDASARPAPARVQSLRNVRPQVQNASNNNPRPPTQPAVQNPNNNNPRPSTQPAAQNPNNNNNPRPSTQPTVQPAPVNSNPAITGRQTSSRFNPNPGINQPVQQQRSLPQPSPANRAQMQLKPATRPPASQARPIRQTPQNQQHKLPATKPAKEKEKPKPSEAN